MAQLTLELIDALQQQTNAELALLLQQSDYQKVADVCFAVINLTADSRSGSELIKTNFRRFLYAVHLLQLQVHHRILKPMDVDNLFRIAEASLHLCGVREGSQLGFLFDELHTCRAHLLHLDNKPLAAQWLMAIGKRHVPSDQFWIHSAISETSAAFHLGYAHEAAATFSKLLPLAADEEQAIFINSLLIKSLRLSGQIDAARSRIARLADDHRLTEKMQQFVFWENIWLRLAKTGDSERLEQAVRTGKEYPDEPFLSQIYLTFHAHPSASRLIKALPSVATVRKRYPKTLSASDKVMLEVFDVLSAINTTETPIGVRLARIATVLDSISILHAEYRSLILLAFARWTTRYRQHRFTSILLDQYQSLSGRMTSHASIDVLGLAHDLGKTDGVLGSVREVIAQHESKSARLEPRSIARSLRIMMHMSKINWRMLRADKTSMDDLKRLVISVFKDASAGGLIVRGPYAKALQFSSIAMAGALEIYDEINADIQSIYRSTPMESRIDFAATVEQQFGKLPKEIFSEWDSQPFGCGSVSQVFRARLLNGDQVAVKIQHPDIQNTAREDFALFKKLLIGGHFGKWLNSKMLANFEKRFLEETDFQREAHYFQVFYEKSRAIPDLLVPRVYPQLCSSTCITMGYCDGEDLDQYLVRASQADLNRLGMAFLRFTFYSLAAGLMKVDCFARNFKVVNGQLCVFDFGRVYEMSAARRAEYDRFLTVRAQTPQSFDLNDIPATFGPRELDVRFKKIIADLFALIDTPGERPFTDILPDFGMPFLEAINQSRWVVEDFPEHFFPEGEMWLGFIHLMNQLKPVADWYAFKLECERLAPRLKAS